MPATPPPLTEADFHLLFEQSPDVYLVLDPDFTIVGANAARLRATQSTLEGTLGRNVFDAFPDNPSDPEATGVRNLRASLERVLRTKAPDEMPLQRYDLERPREQGGGWEVRYWRPVNTPVLRPDGSIAFILHKVEDVTELIRLQENTVKLAREEIARAEAEAAQERITAILESITDGFSALDGELRYTYVNRHAEEFLGRRREDVIGKRYRDLDPCFAGSESEARMVKALRERAPQHYETLSNATGRWLEVFVYPSPEGLSVFSRDVTDRKRAEAAIRESEERYRLLVDMIPQHIWLTDAEGQHTFFSRRWLEYTGATSEEHVGMGWLATLHPDDKERTLARWQHSLRTGEPYSIEYRFRGADGLYRWFLGQAMPLRNEADEIVSWFGTLTDISERKRLDEERERLLAREQAAREQVTSILESITDAFFAVNRAWRFTYVNREAERVLRRSRDELLGSSLWDSFPDAVGSTFSREYRRALSENVTVDFEEHFDPLKAWFEVHAYPSPDGLSVYFRDITERRRAEEVRTRLATIIESTPDFVGSFDDKGRGLVLNQAARRMLGLPDGVEATSLSLGDIYPPDAVRRVFAEGIPAALREGAWRAETAIRSREDDLRPVSQVLLAHRDAAGEVTSFSTVMHDIAELKRTEELQQFLAETSRTLVGSLEYEATLESVVRIMVPRVADFCIVYVSEGDTLRTHALAHADPAAEARLAQLRHSVPPPDAPVGVRAVLRTGEPEFVPDVTTTWLWAASSDEERFQVLSDMRPRSCIIVPLIARDETLGAMALYSSRAGRAYTRAELALAQGVADRAAFAIHNARLYRDSVQATRLRDEVLGVVSHDLRNPVSTILLAARQLDTALASAGATPTTRRKVDIIRKSAGRAETLINDLLDVARMRAGQLTVDTSAAPARALLEEALELHRPLAEAKGLRLELADEEDLPEVLADHDRVIQVLANIIGNAVKFTPGGGRLALGAEQSGREVVFSVSDTGPGIPPEHAPLLFDEFWQARRGNRSGAGLGLAISRGILEAHGGRIWVESDGKSGSTFRFSLPVAHAAARTAPELHH